MALVCGWTCLDLASDVSLRALASLGTRILLLDASELRCREVDGKDVCFPLSEVMPGANLLGASRAAAVLATKGGAQITLLQLHESIRRCIVLDVEAPIHAIASSRDWIAVLHGDPHSVSLFAASGEMVPAPLPSRLPPRKRAIVAIAAGGRHLLMLDNEGNVLSIGSNAYGQLGTQDEEEEEEATSEVPRLVVMPDRVNSIAAGAWHSMAATSGGNVYVWGSNESGQLGLGNAKSGRRSPKLLKGLLNCVRVACGTRHSSALLSDGRMYHWGFWGAEIHATPMRCPSMSLDVTKRELISFDAGGWHTWIIAAPKSDAFTPLRQ